MIPTRPIRCTVLHIMGARYFLGIMKNNMTPTKIIALLLRIIIREEINMCHIIISHIVTTI